MSQRSYSQSTPNFGKDKTIPEVSPEKKLKRRVANAIYGAPDDIVQKFARILKIKID